MTHGPVSPVASFPTGKAEWIRLIYDEALQFHQQVSLFKHEKTINLYIYSLPRHLVSSAS